MSFLYSLLRPLLFALPAETAHNYTLFALKNGVYPRYKAEPQPCLQQSLLGLNFDSPVGLAAGFDKNAETMRAMFGMGMSFVEIGTVTPKPQAGNPRPRVFRNPENEAVINRMGFPNLGADFFKNNLLAFLKDKTPNQILGINIGKNKDTEDPYADYVSLIESLGNDADYITVNISSPNTPGLRDLQKIEILAQLIDQVIAARKKYCKKHKPPLLFKLAPDLSDSEIDAIASLFLDKKLDGIILANTTLDRPDYLPEEFRNQQGGLSGKPARDKSTASIHRFYEKTKGQIPIIGIGGILSAEDAYAKIKAGASLVQLYTGLIYKGPELIQDIHNKLPVLLKQDGYNHISEAIGADHKTTKSNGKKVA